MQNLQHPSLYENNKGTLESNYDRFLRWVEKGQYEASVGGSLAPIGWVGLLEVDRHLQALARDETELEWADIPDLGWYIVHIDMQGIVYGYRYGQRILHEEGARADFAKVQRVYDELYGEALAEEIIAFLDGRWT